MTFQRRGQQPDTDKYNEESPKLSVPKKVEPPKLSKEERRERILPGKKSAARFEPTTEAEIRATGSILYKPGSTELEKFVADTLLSHKIAAKFIESAGRVESEPDIREAGHFKRMADKLLDDTDRAVVEKVLIRLATLASRVKNDNEK